jgi:hypothetical protein
MNFISFLNIRLLLRFQDLSGDRHRGRGKLLAVGEVDVMPREAERGSHLSVLKKRLSRFLITLLNI